MSTLTDKIRAVFLAKPQDAEYVIDPQVAPADFHFHEVGGQRILTIVRARSVVESIVFPACDPNDHWACTRLHVLVGKLDRMFREAMVDVTVVAEAIRTFELQMNASTQKAYDNLRSIHCVYFRDMDAKTVAMIPRLISHILSEGRIGLEPEPVPSAPAQKQISHAD